MRSIVYIYGLSNTFMVFRFSAFYRILGLNQDGCTHLMRFMYCSCMFKNLDALMYEFIQVIWKILKKQNKKYAFN